MKSSYILCYISLHVFGCYMSLLVIHALLVICHLAVSCFGLVIPRSIFSYMLYVPTYINCISPLFHVFTCLYCLYLTCCTLLCYIRFFDSFDYSFINDFVEVCEYEIMVALCLY